jgi:hypothetical protein
MCGNGSISGNQSGCPDYASAHGSACDVRHGVCISSQWRIVLGTKVMADEEAKRFRKGTLCQLLEIKSDYL